jgi:hypothetical protein
MKNNLPSFILLTLLTINSTATPTAPKDTEINEVLVLTIQTIKDVFPDLSNIKERHYADVIGEIKGVLITLKDAAEYQDNALKETIFREALTELNKSLERSYSLALQMTEEANNAQSKAERNQDIEHARALEKLYKQLAALKKELHLMFNENNTATRFQKESAKNLEQLNQKIIAANNAQLPLVDDETRQTILQMIGAAVIGAIMFIIGSISSN